MSDNEINIAIAEACGWDMDPAACREWVSRGKWCEDPSGQLTFRHNIPKYTTDLNAMQDAESTLKGLYRIMFARRLRLAAGTKYQPGKIDQGSFAHVHANARERAEAFLRTIGKWKGAE